MVTASDDRTARIWDAATGKPLGALLEHKTSVTGVVFSLDGARIVTASDDKTARIWRIRIDERTPDEWAALGERSPFVLGGSVHVRRAMR